MTNKGRFGVTNKLATLLVVLLAASASAQDFSAGPKQDPAVAATSAARVKANAALEARDYAAAEKLLGPLAAATPKDARLLYDLGSAQDAQDESSAAEASYRTSIADDPKFVDPRVALGLLLARGGKLDAARVEFAAAAALPEGDAALRARAFRAMARIDEKARPAEARDELLTALKLTPETAEDTLLAAELAAGANGGSGAAEAAYRRVLLEHPNDPEATAGLARLMAAEKHTGEAELLLTKALEAHPGDPALTVQLASTFAAAGKPAQAVPLVEALAKAEPRNADVARLLAGLYVDAGEWAKAEPLLAAIMARNPTDARSADDRGRALMHLQRYAEAEVVLARIVAQPALFATPAALGDAAADLAFAASENKDPAAALHAIEVRATVLSIPPALLFVKAISEDRLHHIKAAEQAYQEFLTASNGAYPDQEFEARHRLVALKPLR